MYSRRSTRSENLIICWKNAPKWQTIYKFLLSCGSSTHTFDTSRRKTENWKSEEWTIRERRTHACQPTRTHRMIYKMGGKKVDNDLLQYRCTMNPTANRLDKDQLFATTKKRFFCIREKKMRVSKMRSLRSIFSLFFFNCSATYFACVYEGLPSRHSTVFFRDVKAAADHDCRKGRGDFCSSRHHYTFSEDKPGT